MRKYSSLLLTCAALFLSFVAIGPLQASIDGMKLAEHPDSYFTEYNVHEYHPSLPPPTPEGLKRYSNKLRKQFEAEGLPKHAIDQMVKDLVEEAKKPTGGSSEFVQFFGAGRGSILYGMRGKDMSVPNYFIVKPTGWMKCDSSKPIKGNEYPILEILPIDPKDPPKKAEWKQEAAILGFESLEILFEGQPTVTKKADGCMALEYLVPSEQHHNAERKTVVLDKEGRIISISNQESSQAEGRWDEKWTVSDYRPAGKGWVPGIITRKLYIGKKLTNTLDYKLTKIETGQPVINKWFSNRVQGPTIVEDSRFNGVKVKYFTRDKLLSDKEVMRRAKLQANTGRPVMGPKSSTKALGILFLLVGVGLLIWGLGRPKKKPKSE